MLNGGFESPDAVELKVIQQGPAAPCHSAWGLVASDLQYPTEVAAEINAFLAAPGPKAMKRDFHSPRPRPGAVEAV